MLWGQAIYFFQVFTLTFTINQNSTDLVSSHQFHHSIAFIFMLLLSLNKQSKPEKWCCFYTQMKVYLASLYLFPFFYSSTIRHFSLFLCCCSECETASYIIIQTVASTQRIKILYETWITESHNGLRNRKLKSKEFSNYY